MRQLLLLALTLTACFCLNIQAKDLPAYRLGDVAGADVVTPVALDVVDTNATAALRLIKSQQYPSIFRSWPEATNIMARNFLAAFAQARTNFLADVQIEFHATMLDEASVASADFGRLVTVFGVENKNFPVSDGLAVEWARGQDGETVRNRLLATLEWAAGRPMRPDALPQGLVVGETIRLVPATDLEQKLSFELVQQGSLVPAANVMTVSNAQALFRREFPAEQQLFARALAAFIQPNCFPDAPFTQLTRGTAVYKLVVSDHFDAGDTIVHRGDAIDAKMLAGLVALNEKLASAPVATPVAAIAQQLPSGPVPKVVPESTDRNPALVASASVPKSGLPHAALIWSLAGISAASLLVALWQYLKERGRPKISALVAQPPLLLPGAVKPDLAPQVAQAVREAVQRELALQRRELLMAQQAATDEIAALVRRLDDLQMPMQERLHTYESRIQSLEKELAVRNEENRELLKLKIDMISRQMETERTATITGTRNV